MDIGKKIQTGSKLIKDMQAASKRMNLHQGACRSLLVLPCRRRKMKSWSSTHGNVMRRAGAARAARAARVAVSDSKCDSRDSKIIYST